MGDNKASIDEDLTSEKYDKEELRSLLRRDYLSVGEGLLILVSVDKEQIAQNVKRAYGELDTVEWCSRYGEALNYAYTMDQAKLSLEWHYSKHNKKPLLKAAPGCLGNEVSPIEELYPREYFIKWAIEKGIEVPWLDWMIEEGLVQNDILTETESKAKNAEDEKPHPMTKRTYLRLILALLADKGIDVASGEDARKAIKDLTDMKYETVTNLLGDLRDQSSKDTDN